MERMAAPAQDRDGHGADGRIAEDVLRWGYTYWRSWAVPPSTFICFALQPGPPISPATGTPKRLVQAPWAEASRTTTARWSRRFSGSECACWPAAACRAARALRVSG